VLRFAVSWELGPILSPFSTKKAAPREDGRKRQRPANGCLCFPNAQRQVPLLRAEQERGAKLRAELWCEKIRAGFVKIKKRATSLDRARLALPRSAESGNEVLTHNDFLSREKTPYVEESFCVCLYLVVLFRAGTAHATLLGNI
jgi:hypothetical protein